MRMKNQPACAACGGGMTVFCEFLQVPVNSCLLVDDPATARALQKGDLRLGFCPSCGFIANTAYVEPLTTYAAGYEETQAFSPRFRTFADELAQRWISSYGLYGKRVLEIGCGKAEFLATLAEVGGNDCLGVDPATDLSRVPSTSQGKLQVLLEPFQLRHTVPPVDAVVCRHTLEHIRPVADFLRNVRAGVHASTVLLFELPDTARVLREGALEDVYYEHCSYFTAGSLSRLFRRSGFKVLNISLAYEGQYLVLEAVAGAVDTCLTDEDMVDIADTAAAVEHFRQAFSSAAEHWRATLRAARAEGRRTVLWGGGSKAVAFLTTLGEEVSDAVEAVVDINTHKQGKAMPGTGHPVVSPESLTGTPPDLVVVMNPIYRDEISTMLHDMGLTAELVALGR